MFSQPENVVPNKIHLIWLGSPPSEEVLKNTKRWKKTNNKHQVHLWIDSGTYQDKVQILECKKLHDWAKENDIIICDVNPNPVYQSESNAFRNMSSVYENMLSKEQYNDQINGIYKNLSFASDILRFEILYQLGGIYADVNDIYPDKRFPMSMRAPFGFYCHLGEMDAVNSDVLASIPRGTLIAACRKKINQNLAELYEQQPDTPLKAHRNPDFARASLYSGSNPRYLFGIEHGGPGVVAWVIRQYQSKSNPIPEALSAPTKDNDFKLNSAYFSEPESGQAGSWYGRKIEKYEQANAIFRSYVIDYFNKIIDDACSEMKNPDQQSDNSSLVELLQKLRKKLNALPPYLSMTELVNVAIGEFAQHEIENINAHTHLVERLSQASLNLEQMLDYIQVQEKLTPQEIVDGLRLGNDVPMEERLALLDTYGYKKQRGLIESGAHNVTTVFIKNGIDNGCDKANYQALNTFIEGVEKIKADSEKSQLFHPRLL